jgi:hypothetical protein
MTPQDRVRKERIFNPLMKFNVPSRMPRNAAPVGRYLLDAMILFIWDVEEEEFFCYSAATDIHQARRMILESCKGSKRVEWILSKYPPRVVRSPECGIIAPDSEIPNIFHCLPEISA